MIGACVAPDNLVSDRLFYYIIPGFIILLLGIIFSVFYRVDLEGEITSVA